MAKVMEPAGAERLTGWAKGNPTTLRPLRPALPGARDDPLHVPPGAYTAGGLGGAARRGGTLGECWVRTGQQPGYKPDRMIPLGWTVNGDPFRMGEKYCN